MTEPTNLCLYHANCSDGLVAAYLLNIYFKELNLEADFIVVKYNEPMPDVTGKHVYIVDFSYSKEEILEASKVALSIIMLDHHLGAAQQWGGYGNHDTKLLIIGDPDFTYGCPIHINIVEDQSGAGIVYDYVREAIRANKTDKELQESVFFNLDDDRLGRIVRAVQDRDLWLFELSDTKYIHEMLESNPKDFQSLDHLIFNIPYEQFVDDLETAKYYFLCKEKLAYDYASKYQLITFSGYTIPIVNCPANFASRVGEILGQTHPFALTYCLSTTKVFCSLRSNIIVGVDVNEIAKRYNGGGHVHAAGMSLLPNQLIDLFEGKL